MLSRRPAGSTAARPRAHSTGGEEGLGLADRSWDDGLAGSVVTTGPTNLRAKSLHRLTATVERPVAYSTATFPMRAPKESNFGVGIGAAAIEAPN